MVTAKLLYYLTHSLAFQIKAVGLSLTPQVSCLSSHLSLHSCFFFYTHARTLKYVLLKKKDLGHLAKWSPITTNASPQFLDSRCQHADPALELSSNFSHLASLAPFDDARNKTRNCFRYATPEAEVGGDRGWDSSGMIQTCQEGQWVYDHDTMFETVASEVDKMLLVCEWFISLSGRALDHFTILELSKPSIDVSRLHNFVVWEL